jgi:hypothetical protein
LNAEKIGFVAIFAGERFAGQTVFGMSGERNACAIGAPDCDGGPRGMRNVTIKLSGSYYA